MGEEEETEIEEEEEEVKENDPYTPTFNDTTKKFKYLKDPKKEKYAECKTCRIRIYHKQAVSVIKCNFCGYKRPTTKKKFVAIKRRCSMCGKKRLVQEYINEKTQEKRILCNQCAGVKK